jgi:hypothetical protein
LAITYRKVAELLNSDVVDLQGTPGAIFPNTQCDIASKFNSHNFVINCE